MSSLKDQMSDDEDDRGAMRLAEVLGITYDELEQTQWAFEEKKDSDGVMTYLLVIFNQSSPSHILKKIDGLDENNTVWLEPDALEREDNEYYEEGEAD